MKDPEFPQDAVTKNYVDHRYVINSVGYIPVNINNNSKVGFVASACSESHSAYKAFGINNSSEWLVAEGITSDFWIQIELPEIIKIYKFALRNKRSAIARDIKIGYSKDRWMVYISIFYLREKTNHLVTPFNFSPST